MHIYAFGSICRGDIDLSSDIDLLALVEGFDSRLDPSKFSIYSYKRIQEIWTNGNPFAWHLAIESKLLYSTDGRDFLKELDDPNTYDNMHEDCEKFAQIFRDGSEAVASGTDSPVFELSSIFLAIRNFATCFSLGTSRQKEFSRYAAIRLQECPVPVGMDVFKILERARILSTRGTGRPISQSEIDIVIAELPVIKEWINNLLKEIK